MKLLTRSLLASLVCTAAVAVLAGVPGTQPKDTPSTSPADNPATVPTGGSATNPSTRPTTRIYTPEPADAR